MKIEMQFTIEVSKPLDADQAQEVADAIATIAAPGKKYQTTQERLRAMKLCESVGLHFLLAFADVD